MTHSGGKPHAVGDHGQQYEVTYFDPVANARKVFGWSNTAEGAQSMARSVELHPSMGHFVQIRDRHATGMYASPVPPEDRPEEGMDDPIGGVDG